MTLAKTPRAPRRIPKFPNSGLGALGALARDLLYL
jgi:hypothetical protein